MVTADGAGAGAPHGSDEAAVLVGGGGCETGLPKSKFKSKRSVEGFPFRELP